MNDFTREELEELSICVGDYKSECSKGYHDLIYPELRDKIDGMIDDYQEENELYSCHTGLAVSDDYFSKKESMGAEDLIPEVHQLVTQCDGMIKHSGLYAIKLRLVKLK